MATEITVLKKNLAGPDFDALLVDADTVGGNSFLNDGSTYLYVENKHATSAATVDITAAGKFQGQTISNPAQVNIAALKWTVLGPFPRDIYNTPNGAQAGQVSVLVAGAGAADVDLIPFH